MPEPLTIYKLLILYMLNQVDFPLTNAQVSDFVLEKEYTNFLTLQQALNELSEAGFVLQRTQGNRTHLVITEEGRETLSFFEQQLSHTIKDEINDYLKTNELQIRNEVSILSDYYKTTNGDFEAHLTALEKGAPLVDIKIAVPVEETAISICNNWQTKNQTIYEYLVGELF